LRTFFLLHDRIKNFFSRYKTLIISVLILFALAFLTGCFYIAKLDIVSNEYITDLVLKKFLQNNISQIEFCFLKMLFWLVTFAICFMFSFLSFGWIFVVFAFVYKSFSLGISFLIIIRLCGVIKGIVVALFGYVISQLLLILIFCLLFLILNKQNKQFCHFGNCCLRKFELKIILKVFIFQVLLVFLESFLLFILKGVFIFI